MAQQTPSSSSFLSFFISLCGKIGPDSYSRFSHRLWRPGDASASLLLSLFDHFFLIPHFNTFLSLAAFLRRQYYEMLYNTADELLNLVVDQGVRYTELEYINALSLLHRSQTGVGDLSTQNVRLQRLKEIICEQAAIKQASKDKKITTV